MTEREELRGGKPVTVVEREAHEQTPEERQAALEASACSVTKCSGPLYCARGGARRMSRV